MLICKEIGHLEPTKIHILLPHSYLRMEAHNTKVNNTKAIIKDISIIAAKTIIGVAKIIRVHPMTVRESFTSYGNTGEARNTLEFPIDFESGDFHV